MFDHQRPHSTHSGHLCTHLQDVIGYRASWNQNVEHLLNQAKARYLKQS